MQKLERLSAWYLLRLPVSVRRQSQDCCKIVKVRALDDGHEVPISTLWVHSDYPDIAFVDLCPDPVLPDPVDYVLEVEMAE